MESLTQQLEKLHQPINSTLFRLLCFLFAMGHTALFLWEPTQYAEAIGGFNPILGFLFVWSLCSGVIFGVGFIPIFWLWRLVFTPYLPLGLLSYLTVAYAIG